MTNTLPTIESFGVSKEMDATLEVVDEVIERAGAENASRVAGMIAHVTSLTLGEKIDALGVADDRVEFSDVQLLQRSLILAAAHRLMAQRRTKSGKRSIARRYS